MKLSAIIVTYFPEIDDLIKNVESCYSDVEKIIIWENSPNNSLKTLKELGPYLEKIIFLGDGKNVGIGRALNKGVEWSINNNFTHILTLDQDSHFEPGVLSEYKQLVSLKTDPDIGVFGINPVCGNNPLFSLPNQFFQVADTITSGSIFPLSIFNRCGMFMEELFIDAVDYEFCYRIYKKSKLKTMVFNDIMLQHKVGYVHRSRWGFKTDNYSAFRTYFIVRNHISMWKWYPDIFTKSHKKVLIKTHIISRVVKIVLGEKDKAKKIKAIFKGLIHGLQGRLGYYNVN